MNYAYGEEILQVVHTLLQDVAEDPKRLDRAMESATDQIGAIIQKREEYE